MVWIKNLVVCFLILWYYYLLLDIFFNSSCSNTWIKDDLQVNHYVTIEPFMESSEDMEEDLEEIYDAEVFYFISFFLFDILGTLILHIIGTLLLFIEYS